MAEQVGRVLGGRYRLVAPIGTGASAQVYLADDVTLRRQVAVKLLHESLADDGTFLRRFRAEARTAAALNHPQVVAVHDWGEDSLPFIVTEYLAGGSLRSLLDRHGVVTPSQALLIGLEAARGLVYAHKRGLVHRDIKPANLLFDADGHVRVADFGLARALAEASITEPTGAVLGTARYASPEQAKGERLDGRSDVYALALVLVEAVTGEVPFVADTTVGTLMARVDREVELGPELGPLRSVLQRALHPDVEQRPDAGTFEVGLMAAAERLPRPEPLPLVGAIEHDRLPVAELDRTMLPDPAGSGSAGAEGAPDPTPEPTGEAPGVSTGAAGKGSGRQARRPVGPTRRAGASKRRARRSATASSGRRGPRRRRRLAVMSLLSVLVVAGVVVGAVLAWQAAQTPSHAVPDLTGVPEARLAEELAEFNWQLVRREDRADDSVPGTVLRQDPEPGFELEEGRQLTVWISLGNALRPVPRDELLDVTFEDAATILTNAGLTAAEPTSRFDEGAPVGTVVEVNESADMLPTGSAVELVLSDGPAPRAVPTDIAAGMSVADAEALLGAARLVPVLAEDYSSSVGRGLVIGVNPAPGTEVAADSQVTIVVSLGPEPVPVPNVRDLSVSEATAALQAVGLRVSGVDGSPTGTVLITEPEAGTVVDVGASVRLVTRSS